MLFKGTSFSICCIGIVEDCRVLSLLLAPSSYSTFTSVAADGLFVCCCAFKVGSVADVFLTVVSVVL